MNINHTKSTSYYTNLILCTCEGATQGTLFLLLRPTIQKRTIDIIATMAKMNGLYLFNGNLQEQYSYYAESICTSAIFLGDRRSLFHSLTIIYFCFGKTPTELPRRTTYFRMFCCKLVLVLKQYTKVIYTWSCGAITKFCSYQFQLVAILFLFEINFLIYAG